mmetsp:Transcript_22819/g.38076  ORF Transcript_22819/g.38076 Transcript_22819/m.38076 type:complete len:526 (-) Transcript_22819:1273-2850(-)
MSLEIESQDVIRLMLQFLKEHNLSDSMKELQRESGVTLNTVDSVETFASDVRHGRWDSVLAQVSALKLPSDKLTSLYEQVVLELLESGERDLAQAMLRSVEPLTELRSSHAERYMKLEHFCRRPFFNASEAYEMGSSKDLRRKEIADSLVCEVSVVEPARLLALLGQALKYQQGQNLIPPGVPFDLFRNARKAVKRDVEEKNPTKVSDIIRSHRAHKIDCLAFSPDGQSLATASSEGHVEIWDVEANKLRIDLDHQARGECIHMDHSVLCCVFSKDGEQLATGSAGGQIQVWKVTTGAGLRSFPQAHPQGITSVNFYRDGTQILSTSFDQTARIHGLKSGRALKEFRGHTSFVNCAQYTKDSSNTVITGSADGTVKLWDLRSTECLLTFRPGATPDATMTRTASVISIKLVPNSTDQVFVGMSDSHAYIFTLQGQLQRRFALNTSKLHNGADFTAATISPQGKWIYCVNEDRNMYIFDAKTGQLENTLCVSDNSASQQVLCLEHHPHRNILVTSLGTEIVKVWKP